MLHLLNDELLFTFVADFKKSVTSHVLNTRVHLMHELEEFVDHCPQEFPMNSQKFGILPDHIPSHNNPR